MAEPGASPSSGSVLPACINVELRGQGLPGKCQLSGSQAHVTETSPMEISKAGLEGRVWAL